MLYEKGLIKSGWWCQMVTVGYEYAKGKRVVGQTESVGFEIGVQKIMPAPPQKVWKVVNSEKGKKLWEKGAETKIKTIREGERMRMLWKLKGWEKPSTLQVSLFCPRNTKIKTNLRFHQEKLKDSKTRESMRAHRKKVLNGLSGLV